jgi:predicted GNAT family acetyltransferase
MLEAELEHKYKDQLQDLSIYEKNDSLVVKSIIVKPELRESGYGTKIMEDIIQYADDNNKIVALTPSDSYGGNKNRLIKFYKQFGFVPNKGRNKDFSFMETMIRYPKNINEMKKNTTENPQDILKMNVPLFIRLIEYAREDAETDMDLHDVTERLIKLSLKGNLLTMDDYDSIVIPKKEDKPKKKSELYESKITLKTMDETPESSIYFITKKGRAIGGVEVSNISNKPSDNELMLIDFKVPEDENPLAVINYALRLLYKKFPNVKKISLNVKPSNKYFWEKVGAQRISDTLYTFYR